jgi:hypothetical protein
MNNKNRLFKYITLLLLIIPGSVLAHGVASGDAKFIEGVSGTQLIPFIYLGAKHMVTGYDHLLFLFGVIFFLYRLKDVAIYVTLFAVGHSVTLLFGVLNSVHVNPYIIDAIIGLSVAYKALDNLGAYKVWFGFQPNTKVAVFIFGLFHGFGLATKLQDFTLSEDGLVPNIISFNIGVEFGQLLALTFILLAMDYWRKTDAFVHQAFAANVVLMSAGFLLFAYQLSGFMINP